MTLAKGLTSGYIPMGACVASDVVFEEFLGEPEEIESSHRSVPTVDILSHVQQD